MIKDQKSRKIIEEKYGWMKIRVPMDTEAAEQVILEGMFPRVKPERKRKATAND